jgi:hypothetical protein
VTQLQLPIPLDCPPSIQLEAARRLQRIVERNRESYRCEQYRRHRAAALKAKRGLA